MGCTSGCMKVILNIFNSIFFLTGVLLIVLGVLSLKSAPAPYLYFLFIVGGFNLVAALFGCCGICQENVCMTATYAVIILASLLAQAYNKIKPINLDEVKKFIRDDVEKSWDMEKTNPGAMDTTQQTYQCCGRLGPSDYQHMGKFIIPASCYPNNVIDRSALYQNGCIISAENKILKIFSYVSASEWGCVAVTAVMLIFAIYLAFRFHNKQHRYRY